MMLSRFATLALFAAAMAASTSHIVAARPRALLQDDPAALLERIEELVNMTNEDVSERLANDTQVRVNSVRATIAHARRHAGTHDGRRDAVAKTQGSIV